MKRIIYTGALLMTSFVTLAQQQGSNLTYFEVKQLDGLLEKKHVSQETLREMGASHIKNAAYSDAHPFFERLFQNGTELIASDYFNYAQCLRVKGNYAEAEANLKKYAELEGKSHQSHEGSTYLSTIKEQSNRYAIKTVGMNSDQSEIPVGFNGNTLFFMTNRASGVRDYSTDSKTYNIWEGTINANGAISSEVKTENINKRLHEGGMTISSDGKWGYFTQSDKKSGQLMIIRAINVSGEWIPQESAHFSSPEYSVMHPALSSDNKHLYFVSNMPGGNGLTDIYVSDILEGGELGQATNLGLAVNTIGQEAFPFVDKDGNLYFSSNGHNSLGGLDVFVSLKDRTTRKFKEAINVGEPVNTKFDDFGYLLTSEKNGYFASNRTGGSGGDDIYGFTEQIPLRVIGDMKFNKLDVIASGKYSSEKKIQQGSYYLLPNDASVIKNPQNGLDKVYLNSDGTVSSESPIELGDYFVVAEDELDANTGDLSYQSIQLTDSENFDTEGYIKDGFYYLVPKDPSKASKSKVLSEPTEVRPDGSYLAKENFDKGSYYLIPKEAEQVANTQVVGNTAQVQAGGVIKFEKGTEAGKYALIPKNASSINQLEGVELIDILANNQYIANSVVEKGDYLMVAQDLEKVKEIQGRVPVILKDDGSYRAESDIPTGNFYLIPNSEQNEQRLSGNQVIVRNDGTYEGSENVKQGEYLMIPLESELVGDASVIASKMGLKSDGTIDKGNQALDPGAYYVVDASKASKNAKLQKRTIELDGNGNYKTGEQIDKGSYVLIPSDPSLTMNGNTDLTIELMDDGTYKGSSNLSKGSYYILPKYTELIEDAQLGLDAIQVAADGSYKSKKRLENGNYYFIPREDILNTELANIDQVQGIQTIYFDLNSSVLQQRSVEELEKLIDFLEQNPSNKVQMSGHADQQGSEEYNMWLSERRAQEAVKYLMKEGITKERIFWKAIGELSPTSECPNNDCGDEQYALDRRVEFILFED